MILYGFNKKYILDVATLSGILKAKQKLGRTFNSDKLGELKSDLMSFIMRNTV